MIYLWSRDTERVREREIEMVVTRNWWFFSSFSYLCVGACVYGVVLKTPFEKNNNKTEWEKKRHKWYTDSIT